MKKVKKMFVGFLVLALLVVFNLPLTAKADNSFTIHTKAPAAWGQPGLWAWSAPDGTNVFDKWPGEKLTKDENNDGWFYYSVPSWVNSIIINEGVDGGGQTSDISVKAKELWITVADDFSTTVAYEAPEGFQISTVDTAKETSASDVPKTGESSNIIVWIFAAIISGSAFILVRRKKIAE